MTSPTARGAAATPHAAATAAAEQTLTDGGNAVDAALAAAAILTVVYPNQCSIGGDGIALIGSADGTTTTVNGTGRSADTLVREEYLDAEGRVPVTGARSVTVPGVLGLWEELATQWGSRPLAAALTPAATLAEDGFSLAPGVHRDLLREAGSLARDPGAKAVFLPDDEPLREGGELRLPRLGASLRAIAADGSAAFYRGGLGASVIRTLRSLGSSLSEEDLARHRTELAAPLGTTFDGEEYLSSGGNSQGLFFLAGLAALEDVRQRLGRVPDPLGEDAAVVARILALSAAARDELLGDPERSPLDPRHLLSPDAVSLLAERALSGKAVSGEPAPRHRTDRPVRATGDTVAIVTTDAAGNWVSLIQSAFHSFGSGVVDPGTGILLHNRGASFSADPTSANALGAGRRPAHSLMPVLVRKDGTLVGSHGTMGGRAQPQIHTHLALNLAAGHAPAEAVARPRWVVGTMSAGGTDPEDAFTIAVERDVPSSATAKLQDAGFRTLDLPPLSDDAGHLQLVRADGDGVLAASDPRADG